MIYLSSCLSEIADPLIQELATYLSAAVGVPIRFSGGTWAEREAVLDNNVAQMGWVCGLLHVVKEQRGNWPFVPIAAPVMTAVRYQQQPVYFGDVVVHEDAPFQRLDELANSRWAYNEEASFSGYHMMRHWLRDKPTPFFAAEICSGAHSQSLQLVASGAADCAMIDSTVLDMLAARQQLTLPLRVVGSVGPYPMPPLVVATALPAALRADLQMALCRAHETLGSLLAEWGVAGWTAVQPATYDPIRQLPLGLW